MTKVNFKALDQYVIKPVGVYGSKEEIVRFLLELGVADDSLYVAYYVLCANSSSSGLHNYWRTRALWDNRDEFFVLDCTFFAQPSSKAMRRNRSLSFTGPKKTLGMTLRHLKSAGTA